MIDPIVTKWARQFAGASVLFPRYVQAVIVAEGGMGSIVAAVQCSQPTVTTVDDAVAVTCRSLVHRLADNPGAHPADVLAFLGSYWAPIGADNDPHNKNANWVKNATAAFEALTAEA